MRNFICQENSKVPDRDVVVSVLNGDTEAYALLVKKYQAKIYSIFVRSIQSQAVAAELAQDVFLKAFERLEQFSPENKFSSWINAIAINTLRDYWRKDGRKSSFTDELNVDQTHSDSTVETHILNGSIMQVVQQLPVLYRETLLLRFRDDLSVKEIADSLGIGVSATKMRLKRGIEIVSAAVGGER
ncbi:RNA polymerase sigma factor [Halodesulfovibrio marinisediminis]|uniref:RNA polymerase sigma-70 factor, ECF subfamily n=1 Tax=Halodesulfovibrio marinisediminis DSM 17456 TaxID=1121457 RepID=A0A1N6E8S2_9BACT|nr:sigma-70 family RNA polymerase sigma factor [Halodesulfovibrio marinisediminis]SIN79403.1 RNA polymerase sigma-70 factor, ECF subfamily [Halodesulfovibrio marinisediminis DSM 17456]